MQPGNGISAGVPGIWRNRMSIRTHRPLGCIYLCIQGKPGCVYRGSAIGAYRGAGVRAEWITVIAALATLSIASAAESNAVLEQITVVASGVSNMTAASAGDVSQKQMLSQPLLRPAAVLENVPGLLVTQHSGEGKANQYFLRAFNLDHGTDLALEVDDMPVNKPPPPPAPGDPPRYFLFSAPACRR